MRLVETIRAIDLMRFCGKATHERPWCGAPFSRGAYTYATNGVFMVRVPRRSHVPDVPDAPDAAVPMIGIQSATLSPFKLPRMPKFRAPIEVRCGDCSGTGREHYPCSACECPCSACDGKGCTVQTQEEHEQSICLRGVPFNVAHVRLLSDLPALYFVDKPPTAEPCYFAFGGGDGAIMPMSSPFPDHYGPHPTQRTTP